MKCLLTVAGSEVFQEYQDCDSFSEYPLDPKHFIQCSRQAGKKVVRKREDCQACAHSKGIKVLMRSRERIEQENSEVQHKLGIMNAEIAKKTRELEKIKDSLNLPDQLKKKEKEIADLRSQYELKLRDEKEKNKYLDDACTELQRQVEDLQTVPESVRDAVEKRLSEQKPLFTPPQEVEGSKPTQTIQRVTERQETKKERIIETVTSDPFANQEIECPLRGKQYVDITKECKKGCPDYYQCPFWQEINKGTVPSDAKIRVKEGESKCHG